MSIWNGFDEADIEIHLDEMRFEEDEFFDSTEEESVTGPAQEQR